MNPKSTWQIMLESAKDPEEYAELIATELRPLKRRQVFYGKDVGMFINGEGEKVEGAVNIIRNNSKVRKEASEILKDPKELDRFMLSKTMEDYQKKHFTKVANKLGKPVNQYARDVIKEIHATTPARGLNTVVYKAEPTPDFGEPETWNQKVPEFLEKNFKPEPDPDLVKGLGSLKKRDSD